MNQKEKYAGLLGKSFGKLTIIEVTQTVSSKNRTSHSIKCRCECGNYSTPKLPALTSGGTVSCGCVKKDKWRKAYYAWVTKQDIKL
jgi:hypothetical protein